MMLSSAVASYWLTAPCVICTDFRLPLLSALLSHIQSLVVLVKHVEDKHISCLLVKYFLVLPGLPPAFFLQYSSSHLFSSTFSLASSVLKAKIMLVHAQTHTHTHTYRGLIIAVMSSSDILEQRCGYVHFVNCAWFPKISDLFMWRFFFLLFF